MQQHVLLLLIQNLVFPPDRGALAYVPALRLLPCIQLERLLPRSSNQHLSTALLYNTSVIEIKIWAELPLWP